MASTGLEGLDKILTGLRAGDNVVWQIDDIASYADFVNPFAKKALEYNKKVIYMRFASHEALFKESKQLKVYKLDAYGGFESFTRQVNTIITQEGEGAYYVFDCLSALLSAWATDLMIGNFFMVTCPYLYELNTIAYFAILRDNHSFKTIARIRETTQLLLDLYNQEGVHYVHPLKVWNRYSPTMFFPHLKEKNRFIPVTDSVNAAKLLSYFNRRGVESSKRNLDYWDRLFLEAEEMLERPLSPNERKKMTEKLCKIMVTRDEKIMSLATKNFSIRDLLDIKNRLIGTGLVGGKTVGMLLARKILQKDKSLNWQNLAEPHDSFYIGSDVFYSYIVQNGWWKLYLQQKTKEGYFEVARVLYDRMLYGKFQEEIMEKFQQMIEYFGTSPIIVRSSSLLEDGFGNAFAGKYESFFCANQGTPEQRYMQFIEAVRKIYASTMSENALAYRLQRGLDKLDERMALLVQRVSGSYHKQYFFPDIAGVGISHNTYVWTDEMDPKAGMLRVVLGLGTRAVNRVEGDYPRVVALDAPLLKPHAEMKDTRKFSQHDVDLINVQDNILQTASLTKLINEKLGIKLDRIAIRDYEAIQWMKEKGQKDKEFWILTFDNLFSDKTFLDVMKKILKKLETSYEYPIDIEFTVNFTKDETFKINLLQCRPLQTRGLGKKVEIPKNIKEDELLFESKGYFLGGNSLHPIKRIIYVNPEKYISLGISQKYDVARTVGKLNKQIENREKMPVLLLGPGRWGTTTPSLGVPVNFSEINNITVLGEIAFPGGNLMPELSFGTHFFQDLVETDIFYVALFPDRKEVIFNEGWLFSMENLFEKMVPEAGKYENVIGVYDVDKRNLSVMSDILSQRVVCFSTKPVRGKKLHA